jgi:hypothetical protein
LFGSRDLKTFKKMNKVQNAPPFNALSLSFLRPLASLTGKTKSTPKEGSLLETWAPEVLFSSPFSAPEVLFSGAGIGHDPQGMGLHW